MKYGMIATWRMAVEGITEAAKDLNNGATAGDAIEKAIKMVEDYPLYKVCIGSFNNKANAITLKNTAISKGFNDAYIIH